jgi:hypothetical protein
MGGSGSGTWERYDSKSTVEEYHELPIGRFVPALRKITTGTREWDIVPISWSVHGRKTASILVFVEKLRDRWPTLRLQYTSTSYRDGSQKHDYHVFVTTTSSNLPGNTGQRWWFICPLVVNGRACRRRVAKLYGGELFGCRHCHDLTYQSTRESHELERLAVQLAAELGDVTADEVADELRTWHDIKTLHFMYKAIRFIPTPESMHEFLRERLK